MPKAVDVARKSILYISALVLVAGYPTAAMATAQEPATQPEAQTVVQSEDQTQEIEKKEPTYTYDPVHKKWNSEEWQWNPETESYEKPPEPVIIEPEVSTTSQDSSDQSGEITEDAEQSTEKTIDTNVNVNNTVTSDATSGDALISSNTKAGGALTGDATAVANIINSVNSSVATGENQKVATFTKDIYGDVSGDIILYPMLLKAMLEQEAQNSGATEINATTNFDINNDVNLNAQSGNATVENNTEAGDATTGSATAMANVINILNSMIATQDSFIGTINIYGSLDGDILIAPDFIPQMLANNGGGDGSSAQLSTQDTTTIVNNITAVAESGAADVFGNTNGGNATSGDAESNVVIFNVTGRNIVAENSMLVFVNVLGRWVGMIVDAPAGATAAMIGSGVESSDKHTPDLTLESTSRHGITNTINVTAGSGDATVANNTTGGNATSGNAHAMANVANVSNSSLSLTGWFGLLFINITGDWFGSFALDTAYGNKPDQPTLKPTGPVQFVPQESTPIQNANANRRTVIDSRFAGTTAPVTAANTETEVVTTEEGQKSDETATVLGDTDISDSAATEEENSYLFLAIIGSIALIGGSVIGVRRFLI